MKALLLAAGKATRLGDLSKSTPKCLHQVGDEVLLDRVIRQLQAAGVTEFLINTHHLADRIIDHVSALPFRDHVTVVHEEVLLGTLGTMRTNVDFFEGGSGWVMHADNFIEGSLLPLHAEFALRGATVWGAMLTFATTDPRSCEVVTTDASGIVTGFFEKVPNPPSSRASAATFVFDARAFEFVRRQPSFATDISRDLVPELVGRLTALEHAGEVIDIGTPAGLSRARRLAESVD